MRKPQNPMWDKEIEEKIKKKKELYLKWLSSKDAQTKTEYRKVDKEVKREGIKKKNASWTNKCEELDRYIGGTRTSEAWKTLKTIRQDQGTRETITPISEQDWKEHFKKLLEEDRPQFMEPWIDLQTNSNIHLELTEVQDTIRTMKNRKSPGSGNIPAELLKNGSRKLHQMLLELFQRCLNGENLPENWKICEITPIHKKGSKKNPTNYRGIAVNSSIGRLYAKIVKNRLEEDIKGKEIEEQSGFRAGRSTTDNIFTLKILLEKRRQRNLESHLAFIDLEKA